MIGLVNLNMNSVFSKTNKKMSSSVVNSQKHLMSKSNGNSVTMNKMLLRSYHERVIDHYENPRNVGSLDPKSTWVGTGLKGQPSCGDVLKFQVEVSPEGKVVQAKFKTFGCGSAIASSSLATELVLGKTVDECLDIKNTEIAKHLSLPPVKLHCSMLAEDAIREAIMDFKSKQKVEEQTEKA